MAFVKATKAKAKLRMAITAPSGGGKTRTALEIARVLGDKIAVIDSEYGSASKYADKFDFVVDELDGDYHPDRYIKGLDEAEKAGMDVLIIDSGTHAWEATKGVVDKKKLSDPRGNGYTAWGVGTELWNKFLNRIMSSKMHVIVTMRAKTEYSQEKDEKSGKTIIRKLGLAPEIRDGTEYAFDLVLDMDTDHVGRVTGKTRCDALDGYCHLKPGKDIADILKEWLSDGVERPTPPKPVDQAERAALVADLKTLGISREAWAGVMGSSKTGDMTIEQYDALDAIRHEMQSRNTETNPESPEGDEK